MASGGGAQATVSMALPMAGLVVAVRREAGLFAALSLLVAAAGSAVVGWFGASSEASWTFDPRAVWSWWPGQPSASQIAFVSIVVALGVAALLRRPRSGVSQALVAAGAANAANLALWETIDPAGLVGPTASWFAFIAAGMLSLVLWSALVHLVLVFPTRDRLLERMPWLVPGLYVIPQLLIVAGGLAGGAFAPVSLDWVDGWSRMHAAAASLLLVAAASGIAARFWAVSRSRRRQVAGIAASLAVALLGVLVLVQLPIAFGGDPLVERDLVALLALPIPIFLAAALWRDRSYRLDRLRQSQMQLLLAREEERRRLRRDLHDGLGPALAGVGLKMDTAIAWLGDEPERAGKLLQEARAELTGVMSETRRLVRGLRPPGLAEQGLAEAARRMAEELSPAGTRGPVIDVQVGELPSLPAAVEIAAYRIINESLTNAVRHAEATTARVTVAVTEDELRLQVTDDGVGLPEYARRGVGTEAMRERAEELGGELWIDGQTGGGTRVTATFPLASGGD